VLDDARGGLCGWGVVAHVQIVHEPERAVNAFLDGELVEASGFTALIHENLFPLAGSPLAERGRSVAGVNRKRCIKRMCHCRYIRVAEHAPDLGIVDTRSAAGMEVDTIIDLRHDVARQIMRHPRRQRTAGIAREGTIDILTVRHVAGRTDKPVDIDDGYANCCAACRAVRLTFYETPDHLRAVDLITMHCAHQEQHRAVVLRPRHRNIDFQRRPRGKPCYAYVDLLLLSGKNSGAVEHHRATPIHMAIRFRFQVYVPAIVSPKCNTEGYENSSPVVPASIVSGSDHVTPLSDDMAVASGVRPPQFPSTGLYTSTSLPSSSCVKSMPLLLFGKVVLYMGDHVLP